MPSNLASLPSFLEKPFAMTRRVAIGALALFAPCLLSGHVALADDKGAYFSLVETVPDASYDTWPTVADGHVSQAGPGYSAEFTWTPPPASMGMSGFTASLNVQAIGKSTRISAGVGVSSDSFTFDANPAGTSVLAEVGETKGDSKSIKVTPPGGYTDGSIVELKFGAYYGPGVTYRYKVSSTPVAGTNQPPPPQQLSVALDCPGSIVMSALPSLNCHLIIGHFRRNTADPVEVILPDVLDEFGNHANGIQLVDANGAEDVYNWEEPHSWGFFVFACPSQAHTGANCYDHAATPGTTATVPIIVRQKGAGEVRVNLVLNVLPSKSTPGAGGLGGNGTEVRIGNRWIAGSFINIEGGGPAVGPILLDWLSARWSVDPVPGSSYIRLRSVWKPDQYLNIQGGHLASGPIDPSWQSAMWQLQPIGTSGYYLIENVGDPTQYLNTETQHLESSEIQDDWLSADWWLLR
jgi:hypothetical protein